jgi:hypothetical protein
MKKTLEGRKRTRGWAVEAESRSTIFQEELVNAERRIGRPATGPYVFGARKIGLEASTAIVMTLWQNHMMDAVTRFKGFVLGLSNLSEQPDRRAYIDALQEL